MRSSQKVLSWVAVLLLAGGICATGRALRLYGVGQYREGQRYEDTYYLPAPSALPLLSLGFHDALAALLWCKSMVYFGEEISQRGEVKYVFQYTDAILALAPDFKRPYRWISTAAIYRPKKIELEEGMRAASYLARAVARWPDDGELRWEYGSLLRFELAPLETDKQKKRALWERAAPHLEMAARLGAGPPWLALNNAELLNKLGRTEQAIRQLEELHATTHDPDIQREIEQKLQGLRAHTYLEAIKSAEQQFERARANSYPYLTAGLFLWVGAADEPASYDKWLVDGFVELPQPMESAANASQ